MGAPQTYFVHGFTQLAGYLREAGSRRILVLTSPSRRFTGQLEAALQGMQVDIFDGSAVHVPLEVLDAADARLAGADTVLALGGGSAIGLGKALRLRHPSLRFVVVPTTYAGSEMTSMYGITTGTSKQTGRDERVRPDAVFYDVDLTLDLALPFTVQSLLNAAAHVISCLSTGSLDGEQRGAGIEALRTALRAIEDLVADPTSVPARALAQIAASSCGLAFEHGKPGVQHALAHLLGGALRVDHAPLHAMLLPHVVAHLRATQPGLVRELERALSPVVRSIYSGLPIEGEHDLECYVHDLLTRAGAPVALTALAPAQATTALTAATIPGAVEAALATRPELPPVIARDALHGLRPPGRFGRADLGSEPHALVLGCALDDARLIVLALHGRGAEAGTIARRYRDIVASAGGDDPRVAIVGLRSEGGLPRWYEVRYGEPGAGANPEALRAIARVETALVALSRFGVPIVLAGFSQGACLALEVAARTAHPLAAVLAPCGARLGQPAEWPPGKASMPVLAGAAAEDRWIARADLDATIAWFRAAGADVVDLSGPGDKHEITEAQRTRGRELVRSLL